MSPRGVMIPNFKAVKQRFILKYEAEIFLLISHLDVKKLFGLLGRHFGCRD
jgi:hypothetical protein